MTWGTILGRYLTRCVRGRSSVMCSAFLNPSFQHWTFMRISIRIIQNEVFLCEPELRQGCSQDPSLSVGFTSSTATSGRPHASRMETTHGYRLADGNSR